MYRNRGFLRRLCALKGRAADSVNRPWYPNICIFMYMYHPNLRRPMLTNFPQKNAIKFNKGIKVLQY